MPLKPDTHRLDPPNPRDAYSSVCSLCAHLKLGTETCTAFPGGIPDEIWNGHHKHTRPFPGDHGIQFQQVQPKGL